MRFSPSLILSSSALALTVGLASPALAQDAASKPVCQEGQTENCSPAETPAAESAGPSDRGEIVVTGSRVRRDEYTTAEPLTVITKQEITQAGFNSAADALQSSAVTQGSGQINSYYSGFVVDGGTGANTLGLRNLGPARTLILLNGRRLSPAGTRGSVLAADLNVLPTAIIQKIEILKAGASSIYGSDAIAGVVNIITDNKFRGLDIEAQVNAPGIGAGVDRRVATTFGFGNDRLNVIGSVEYRKRDGVRLRDVKFARCPIGGFLDGEGSAFGSGDFIDPATGQPKCFTLDNGGVTINTLGIPTRTGIGRTSGVAGRFNRFVPAPDVTTGPFPGYLGVGFYDRDTFDPDSQMEYVVSPVKTLTGYLSATYDLDMLGHAQVYGEILATRRKSEAPLYRQLSLDYLTGSPLLPANLRNGVFLAPTPTSSGQTIAARAFIGFGLTDSRQQVDYVRAGGGVRGDFFFPGWHYDVYVGKSWTDGRYEIESFLNDRLSNSLLVVQNPDGSFSCANAASNPTCVPAPALSAAVIGGNLPAAFRDYIMDNTIGTNTFRESTAIASIDGPLFTLPGGKAQLALGAEYRKQRINDTPDQNAINGNLFGLTTSNPTRGSDSVKEAFAEIFLPIMKDIPFVKSFNIDGSLRYTDYRSYGSDTTFKIASEWEPVKGIGFRGSYGTSYRAPALAEQFLGATSGFLGSGTDPCDADNFPANPADYTPNDTITAQNCATIGLDVATFQQNSGVTTFTRGGAEFGLKAETSKNWSVGVVVEPPIPDSLGKLNLALDYFSVKVSNGVSSLGAATILNRCYGDTSFNPTAGFCRFVTRDANNALTVNSDYINLSTDIVKGFEFNGRYAVNLFNGRFTFNANVTHYTEQASKLFPEEFLTDSNGTYVTPNWVGNFDAIYKRGAVTFRYGVEWTDASHGTYDLFAYDSKTGEVDQALAQLYRDNYLLEVPAYFLHSASVQFDVQKNFEFTIGVRNLFNKQPPRISAAVTTIGNAPLYSGYDFVGRNFFVNTNFKF